jgi:hypothetical protein
LIRPALHWVGDDPGVSALLPDGELVHYLYRAEGPGSHRPQRSSRSRTISLISISGPAGTPVQLVRETLFKRFVKGIGLAVEQSCGDADFDRLFYLLTEDPVTAREFGADPILRKAVEAAFAAGAFHMDVDQERGLTLYFRSLPDLLRYDDRHGTRRLDDLVGLCRAIADRRRALPVRETSAAAHRHDRARGWSVLWALAGALLMFAAAIFGGSGYRSSSFASVLLALALFAGPSVCLTFRRSNAVGAFLLLLALLPVALLFSGEFMAVLTSLV